MARKRIYPYPDGDMAMASRVIIENSRKHLDELSLIDVSLTDRYISELEQKNYKVMQKLGIQPRKDQIDATIDLNKLMEPAIRDLKLMKKMISVKFKDEAPQMLYKLGYDQYYKNALLGDQESLISLHFSFKQGMSDILRTQIEGSGINPEIIDRICSRANKLYEANAKQEHEKINATALNQETIDSCNSLYKEVIGICKIAYSFYSHDPAIRNQFSFSRTVKNLNARKSKSEGKEKETDEE
jgi:hypothetical protein